MGWKIGAVLLSVVSLVGAVIRTWEGDYIYLPASLIGLGVAMWLWKKGEDAPPQAEGGGASEQ